MNDYGIENIQKELEKLLSNELKRIGILCRLFSRIKNANSIEDKLNKKQYSNNDKLMQDFFGFRVATYFNDDLEIVVGLCQSLFEEEELVYDEPKAEEFKPLRKNMICRLPDDLLTTYNEVKCSNKEFYKFIDSTFEIQFRTTLSEGWHEVEHLMRYKCKSEWEQLQNENRMLNGIYATLETSDQALKALFDNVAYHHYKGKNWGAMLRNKLRLRFSLNSLDNQFIDYLNKNPNMGKEIFKLDRNEIIYKYIEAKLSLPTTFDNWFLFINYFFCKDEEILSKTPDALIREFDDHSPLTQTP